MIILLINSITTKHAVQIDIKLFKLSKTRIKINYLGFIIFENFFFTHKCTSYFFHIIQVEMIFFFNSNVIRFSIISTAVYIQQSDLFQRLTVTLAKWTQLCDIRFYNTKYGIFYYNKVPLYSFGHYYKQ